MRWLKRGWVPIGLVLVALAMCTTVTLNHSPVLSRYDEWVYYDYVTKIPSQGIVHQGEHIGQQALEQMSCFGDPYGARGEKCMGPNFHYDDYSLYPLAGKTSADIYTPIYFAITWALGSLIRLFTGLDLLTAARLTGFFWLAGGLVAFYGLARQLRINKPTIFGLGLIAIGTTPSMYAHTFITTDAPSFLMGALLMYFGVRYLRGSLSGWWLLPLSSLAVLLKITNIFVIGLLALFMLIYAILHWKRRRSNVHGRPSPPRILLTTVLYVLVSVASEVIWLAIRAAIKVGPSPNEGLSTPLTIRGIASQLTTFLNLPSTNTLDGVLMLPFAILSIVAVFAFLLMAKGRGMDRSLSISTAASMTLFPAILVVAFSFALGSTFPVSTRYSASLMPAVLIAISFLVRNKVVRWMLIGYGVVLVVSIMARSPFLV